jgi:hypothetical protein
MKQELQDKLVDVIGAIQSATGKANDFAMEQLPEIAQQYVMYGRVRSALFFLLFLILAGSSFKYAHWAYKNPWNLSTYFDKDAKRSDSNLVAIATGMVFGVFFTVCAWEAANVLVWVAPKVWLLQALAALVK